MVAPYAFRDVLERAVTAADYATLASDNTRRLAERWRLDPPPASAAAGAAAPGAGGGTGRTRAVACGSVPDPVPGVAECARHAVLGTAVGMRARVRHRPDGHRDRGQRGAGRGGRLSDPVSPDRARRVGHPGQLRPARPRAVDLRQAARTLQAQVEALLRQRLGTGGAAGRHAWGCSTPIASLLARRSISAPIVAGGAIDPGRAGGAGDQGWPASSPAGRRRGPGPDSVPRPTGMLTLGPSEIARLDHGPQRAR